MKQIYNILPKRILQLGISTGFAITLSLTSLAQTAPSKQWDKTFGGPSYDYSTSVVATADGGYIIGGSSGSGIGGDKTQALIGVMDFWIIKLDANGNKQWDKTLGGTGADRLTVMLPAADGGYILGGNSTSGIGNDKSQANLGSDDYWIVKLDAGGNKLWDKTFGGSNTEYLHSIQQTSNGGLIIAGGSLSGVSGDKSQASKGGQDFWIVKTDASGNKQWDKTLGGINVDYPGAIDQTGDGGYIVGGYSESGISGDKTTASKGQSDFWLIKLDSTGTKLWDKTYGGSNYDYLYSLQRTSDGGFILSGDTESGLSGDKTEPSKGLLDIWVVKTDAAGNMIWNKTLGGSGNDEVFTIRQTSDGGYFVVGNSRSPISGDKSQAPKGQIDYWAIKVNSGGSKLWDLTLGGADFDRSSYGAPMPDGGFILIGSSKSGISGDKTEAARGLEDFWVVKLGPQITSLNENKSIFNLSISPNPNQGKFKLQLNNVMAAKAEVTISDVLGREILSKDFSIINQQLSEELTFSAAKGMYLLRVKAGNEIMSRKIVVE